MSSQATRVLNSQQDELDSSEVAERELCFRAFDARNCQFPAPRVPLLPRLTSVSLRFSPNRTFFPIVADAPYRFYSRGRYALHEAYSRAGVEAQGALLVPAYHCRTMLDPAIRLNGRVILYPLDERLAPRISSLARLIERSKTPVRALLLTHYFGFPQNSGELHSFCQERGITLIEDCSHAYFRHQNDGHLGKVGRFVVASPYKFSPAEDGGVLIANQGATDLPESLEMRGLSEQLRSVARVVRKNLQDRFQPDSHAVDGKLAKSGPIDFAQGTESLLQAHQISAMYEPWVENKSGLLLSRLIVQMSDADRIAEIRRANFKHWLHAVRGLPHCRPLFDELPEHVVPYMFPLYIEHPAPHFSALKMLGMPIYRWDEMAVSECPVSQDYRLHLLHLPCHQSLGQAEMDWMTGLVTKVMMEIQES